MESKHKQLLVVDDDPVVCETIRRELVEHGFECRATTSPDEARAIIETQQADLVLADISMPGLTGLDLLTCAKSYAPGCKVVLVTGNSSREYLSRALLLGAYDYVEKPFKPGDLTEVVRKALSGQSSVPLLLERAAAAMETCSQALEASLDSIAALVLAVEAKDPYTRRHSEHVAHYAVGIAKVLGLKPADTHSLRIAALLHDIGKIGVPDHILTKPGPLTEEELQQVRRHPGLGADILTQVRLFAKEARIVRFHHERWDGKGYPDGLTGDESPQASRIIQVADCMDAMLMERTYKKGYDPERMVGELIRCAGTQFDPRIASAAVQWCRSHPDLLITAERRDAVPA